MSKYGTMIKLSTIIKFGNMIKFRTMSKLRTVGKPGTVSKFGTLIKFGTSPLTVLFVATLFSGLFTGCDSGFDPKKNYEEKYLVNLIIKGDSIDQIAVVSRSFNVPGYNPNENTESPFIEGAAISLTSKFYGQTYTFRDTTSTEIGGKYGKPAPIYKLSSMRARPNDSLTLVATMPNGKVLTSKCVVPQVVDIRLSKTYISTVTNNPTKKR